ncbi:MAG: DUF4145 domain-containing protein [Gemmatimonadota bacterium]
MPKLSAALVQRFAELSEQVHSIPQVYHDNEFFYANPKEFFAWSSSALNAIVAAFGAESTHAVGFTAQLEAVRQNMVLELQFETIHGLFLGAKSDVDGGHVFALERTLAGEVFGDMIAGAKFAYSEGHHGVAAVLASAALEDALRRHAAANGLDVDGRTMSDVINALKTKGLVSGAQKTLLSAMPKIRNAAMHADWETLTPQDAASVIAVVEQFVLTSF